MIILFFCGLWNRLGLLGWISHAVNFSGCKEHIGFVNSFTRSLHVGMTIVGPVVTLQWFFYDSIMVLNRL